MYSAIIIKFLAILAASCAGILTLLNFQKDIESHVNAGETYAHIYRKSRILLAEYKDNSQETREIITEFKALTQEYLQANKDNKAWMLTDGA